MPAFAFGNFDAARLVRAREEKGLTAAELAKLIGVTTRTLGLWENRGVTPAPPYLPKLAEAVGLDVFDLYAPEEEPTELAKLRIRAGLSQRALVTLAKAPQSTLSDWERGLAPVPEEKLPQLAAAFGVTLEEVEAAAGTVEKVRPTRRPVFAVYGAGTKKDPWRIAAGDGEPVPLADLGIGPDSTLGETIARLQARRV